MAWGDRKKSLEALEIENKFLREKVEELKEEKRILVDKLDKAYEALVAKESPHAYADLKADQAESKLTEEDIKQREQAKELTRATGELMSTMEGPLFKSAEDMRSMIMRATGPPKIESTHQNDES